MRKVFLFSCCCLITCIVICFFIKYNTPKVVNTTIIDSIKIQNDSIKEIIEHSTEHVREIKTYYEIKINSIDTLSIDNNCIIFSSFVSKDTL